MRSRFGVLPRWGYHRARMHDIRVGTQDVFKHQLELASRNYQYLQERGVRAFNVMGAIGSGKTLLILRLAERLKEKGVRVGAIAGDVAGNDDHQKFVAAGLVAANLNTGDDCHLDAHRVGHALEGFPLEEVDVLFIENVGNLVCPADFPLGTAGDLVVISVTEGDDMVRKHPKIFAQTDVVAVNKVDLAGFVGVDPMVLVDDYRRLNPQGKVVLTDARSGRGVDELLASLGL